MKDDIVSAIAEYTARPGEFSEIAYDTARLCLADSIGCAMLSLNYPACTKLLGPVVPRTIVPGGSRVPGTSFVLDPIRAAFNFGTMIRWLDYNDTWLAAEWGHPSDNIGGLLMVADYLSQQKPISMQTLLEAIIKAYEIQGVLALDNSFNRAGFDHVILVKIATAAVATHLLGGSQDQIFNAVSNAFADAGPLRLYRHAPNTGSRKSWAAGDATSRGVQFAWMSLQGEMGYCQPLSAPRWGLNDVILKDKPLKLGRKLGSYVMENILFKISYPAEFHAQTAVEAAIRLHPLVAGKFDAIASIVIETQESAVRIIDKTGPLKNPADRDHCIQYMTAIGLLKGNLTANDYEDQEASDPRIDKLRSLMSVVENNDFTVGYLDPTKRSIGNKITIKMKDGEVIGPVSVEYPVGHKRRRSEAIPLLMDKLHHNLSTQFDTTQIERILSSIEKEPQVDRFIATLLKSGNSR